MIEIIPGELELTHLRLIHSNHVEVSLVPNARDLIDKSATAVAAIARKCEAA